MPGHGSFTYFILKKYRYRIKTCLQRPLQDFHRTPQDFAPYAARYSHVRQKVKILMSRYLFTYVFSPFIFAHIPFYLGCFCMPILI